MNKDNLGKRMKIYENSYQTETMKRSYTLIRIDGKCFHSYCKNFEKPFDDELIKIMNHTASELCKQIQGVCFAYVQSDEISLLLQDFKDITTERWFNGNIQKIVSISASIATSSFNDLSIIQGIKSEFANFDSRVWCIADRTEVENYFIWRQKDAVRNSIQMVARSLYSHKECENKKSNELQEMIFQKGINWNEYKTSLKRGRIIRKNTIDNYWFVDDYIPEFTQDRTYLDNLIPIIM